MSGFGVELVGQLGYLLLMCGAVGVIAYLFRQPLVLGFLIAGILIGPFGPFSLIKDVDMLNNLTDVAIVLLLFGVGLSFPLSQLRAIGKVGGIIATIEILVMLGIGYAVGSLFGWSFWDSMILAAAISVSSTAIIVKVLEDTGQMETTSATLMIGVLIIEDLLAIVILSTLSSTVTAGVFDFESLGWSLLKILVFIGGTIGAGVLLMPRLFEALSRLERYEITFIVALGIAFGLSYLSYELGFSIATGAFLAGVIIASSRFSEDLASLISPTREIFTAIFFVTIGALMNVQIIAEYWVPILIITIVTIVGKTIGTYAGVRLFGAGGGFALGVGLSMAQLGEFSFIVLKTGQDLGVVSDHLFPIVGAVVVVTTLLAPVLIKFGTRMISPYQ